MYVIVGANGFLGRYLIRTILYNTDSEIIGIVRNPEGLPDLSRVQWIKCDITDKSDFEHTRRILNQGGPYDIIYLAAYHNPDLVAVNPILAWNINITALTEFLNGITNLNSFYYTSTDSVYGVSDNGYHFKENDPVNPVNIYGWQKVAAESLVHSYKHHTVRFPFLLGPSLSLGKKHFYDNIFETLCTGNIIEMFSDSLRSALDFQTAANLLIQVIELGKSCDIPLTLNISGDEDLSKYEIGIRIAHKALKPDKLVKPISIHQNDHIFKTPRAASTLMDNGRLKKLLNLPKIQMQL